MYRLRFSGARRSGKTTTLVNHIVQYVKAKPDAQVLVVTPQTTMGRVIQDMLTDRLEKKIVKVTRDRIELKKGTIHFKTPINKPYHGSRINLLAVDEENYVAQEFLDGLLPCVTPNGTYIGTYTEDE